MADALTPTMEDPNTPGGPCYNPQEPPPLAPPTIPKQKGRRLKPLQLGIGAYCTVNFKSLLWPQNFLIESSSKSARPIPNEKSHCC